MILRLLGPLGALGCSTVCVGPDCADALPAASAVAHRGLPLFGSSDATVDAWASWDGAVTDGSEWRLASDGEVLLVGMPDVGQVARLPLREGSGDALPLQRWAAPDSALGASLAVADLDADGRWDLVVGGPRWDLERGAVAVIYDAAATGSDSALQDVATTLLTGPTSGDGLGNALAVCADRTGDGRPELLVGASRLSGLPEVPDLAGGVFYITSEALAAAKGTSAIVDHATVWWADQVGAAAGTSVSCAADATTDGLPDLFIGAPFHGSDTTTGDQGRVWIVDEAESTTLDAASRTTIDGPGASAWAGEALVSWEDATGPRLAIATPGASDGAGGVYVVDPRSARSGAISALVHIDDPDGLTRHLGRGLTAGDLDADGTFELVLGAPDFQLGRDGYDTGRAWVWSGSTLATLRGNQPLADAGFRVDGDDAFQRVGARPVVVDLDPDELGADLLLPLRAPAQP